MPPVANSGVVPASCGCVAVSRPDRVPPDSLRYPRYTTLRPVLKYVHLILTSKLHMSAHFLASRIAFFEEVLAIIEQADNEMEEDAAGHLRERVRLETVGDNVWIEQFRYAVVFAVISCQIALQA